MENIALVLVNIVSVILTLVFAQDDFGGGEDAGSDMDMESMLQTPGSDAKSDPNAPKPTVKLKTLVEESLSALQQLGFIIGVCFLVGFLFMAMVGVEMAWEKAMDKYNNYRGKNNTSEEQHPASLVGTFSRYKWDQSGV